jgi:hypothetical protein
MGRRLWEEQVTNYTPSGSSAIDVTPSRPKVVGRLSAGQRKVLTVLADRKMDPEKALDQNLLGALSAIRLSSYAGEDGALLEKAIEMQEEQS